MKAAADFVHFTALDVRVGRVLEVEDAATKKPAYRLKLDFGPEIGIKVSCGAFRNYAPAELRGRLVVGVVNFPAKKMGPEISEVLVLGVPGQAGETILLTPASPVEPGVAVF